MLLNSHRRARPDGSMSVLRFLSAMQCGPGQPALLEETYEPATTIFVSN